MIDLHCHVLPGLDDGPPDLARAVALAETAAEAGTLILAATPHLRSDYPRVVPTDLKDRVAELNEALTHHGVGVRVVPGTEVDVSYAHEFSDADLRAATLAGNQRDLLVETPYGSIGASFEEDLADLALRGFRLTLAHPESNRTLQADPSWIRRLVDANLLMQITASSLAAPRRSRARRLAMQMLENDLVHAIASDAHGADRRSPDMRPGLGAAAAAVAGVEPVLRWLVEEAPSAILSGEELPPRPQRMSVSRRRTLRTAAHPRSRRRRIQR